MIYMVTHGQKHPGANPGLTEKGKEQIASLISRLPRNISKTVCGTGKRHLDVATALGLTPDQYTSLVGEPDSLELDEQKNPIIVLADGTKIPEEKLTTLTDNEISAKLFLKELPDNTVICTGRPFLIMLGYKEAGSGAIYGYDRQSKKIVGC